MLVLGIVHLFLTSSKRFSRFPVPERGFSCWNICYAHHFCIHVYFGWGAGHPMTTERKVIPTAVLSLTVWNQSAGKRKETHVSAKGLRSSLIQTGRWQAPQCGDGFFLLNTIKPSFEESQRNSKGALNYTCEASIQFCVKTMNVAARSMLVQRRHAFILCPCHCASLAWMVCGVQRPR